MAYQSTYFNVPDPYSRDLMQWGHTDRNGDDVSESWGARGPRAGVARYDPETKEMQDISNPDWLPGPMRSVVQGAHLAGLNPDDFAWEKVVPGVNYEEAVAAKDPRVKQYWEMLGNAVQQFEPLFALNPIAHNDGIGGLGDIFKNFILPAAAGYAGVSGLGNLIGGAGLGGASTGLSEFGTLASDAGFVPGSFDLGAGAGLDAATAGATGGSLASQVPASLPDIALYTPTPYTAPTDLSLNEILTQAPASLPPTSNPLPPGAEQSPAPVQNGPTTPSTGPGGSVPGLSTAVPAGSALSRIIDGTATTQDWLSTLAGAGSVGASILTGNNQANSLKELADRSWNTGAPYRDKLAATYAPGYDPAATDTSYRNALDDSMNAYLRKASTGGNPFSNPGVSAEALKYVTAGTALPYLQNNRSQLANFGGLSAINSGINQTAQNAVGAQDMGLTNLFGGINQLINPPQTQNQGLADLLKQFKIDFSGKPV